MFSNNFNLLNNQTLNKLSKNRLLSLFIYCKNKVAIKKCKMNIYSNCRKEKLDLR